MNITQFIKYLNKTKKWGIQSQYYSYIDEWRQWWAGYHPSFHRINECGLDGTHHARTILYRAFLGKIGFGAGCMRALCLYYLPAIWVITM